MEIPNVSVQEFYNRVRGSFEGNNHVYRIEAILYESNRATPVRITFDSEQGFVSDQRQRVGNLEIKTG